METIQLFINGLDWRILIKVMGVPVPLSYLQFKNQVVQVTKAQQVIEGILGEKSDVKKSNNQNWWRNNAQRPPPQPFYSHNWRQSSEPGRTNHLKYNSSNTLPSYNNWAVPMDLSRTRAPPPFWPRGGPSWGAYSWMVMAPAYNTTACYNCGREGHFSRNCLYKCNCMPCINLMDIEEDLDFETHPPLAPEPSKSKISRMWTEFNGLSPEEVLEVLRNKGTETESGLGNAWYIRLISGE